MRRALRWLGVGVVGLVGQFLAMVWVGDHVGLVAEVALLPICALIGVVYGLLAATR